MAELDGNTEQSENIYRRQLWEYQRQDKYDEIRLKRFEQASYIVLLIVGIASGIMLGLIVFYAFAVGAEIYLPDNYWHVLLILAAFPTILLLGFIKALSKFNHSTNQNKTNDENNDSINEITELLKQLLDRT